VGWLSRHYRVTYDPNILARTGFLAGSDARRRVELQAAIDDARAAAVVTARGGWGANRITDSIDFGPLTRHPKWLVGFSDATALHASAWHQGVASLHAANLVGLGRGDAESREQWLQALQKPLLPRRLLGEPIVPGRSAGTLVGGNLTIIVHCLSKGRLTLPARCVLALEDVTETSYRIDRLLDTLINSSLVGCVAGVALGQFVDCDAGKFGVPIRDVLNEQFRRLGVPTVCDLPFGHGRANEPLLLGGRATLDAFTGELILGAA
jgi:muramoyltetrapeptide carboxypeptidase